MGSVLHCSAGVGGSVWGAAHVRPIALARCRGPLSPVYPFNLPGGAATFSDDGGVRVPIREPEADVVAHHADL